MWDAVIVVNAEWIITGSEYFICFCLHDFIHSANQPANHLAHAGLEAARAGGSWGYHGEQNRHRPSLTELAPNLGNRQQWLMRGKCRDGRG